MSPTQKIVMNLYIATWIRQLEIMCFFLNKWIPPTYKHRFKRIYLANMWALLELLFICLDRGFSFRAWDNLGCDSLRVRYLLETSGLHTFHIICVVTYKPGYTATSDLVNLLWNEKFRMKITVFSMSCPLLNTTPSDSVNIPIYVGRGRNSFESYGTSN